MAHRQVANPSRRAFLLRSENAPQRLSLTDQCLAANGVTCECCRDACDTGALRFVPYRGSVQKPVLDPGLCTSCGECVKVCPQNAIRISVTEPAHG